MKKLFLFSIIFTILIATSVLAGNIEKDYFYENSTNEPLTNVQALFYTCLNSNCVDASGPWASVNSGDKNYITVEYPGTSTKTNYASYFLAKGYLPKAFMVYGDWGTGKSYEYKNYFNKAENCKAHIDSFVVLNDVQAYIPLQIDVSASLDATTYSAFHQVDNPPYYIPEDQAIRNEFYSAKTLVILDIYDSSSNKVWTDNKVLNIFVDASEKVQFTWIPSKAGQYKATITTNVIDDQCSSSIPEQVSKNFNVIEELKKFCYTLLNNLRTDDIDPAAGQNIKIIAEKISNYQYNNIFDPVSTEINLEILKDSVVVHTDSLDLGANPDYQNFNEFSFDWTPTQEGWYVIRLNAVSDDQKCFGLENLAESETETIYVSAGEKIRLDLNYIGNKQIYEGDRLEFTISAEYTGTKQLKFFASNLPEGSTFSPLTRTFTWQTDYNDAGVYENIQFGVREFPFGSLTDFEYITIEVINKEQGNHAPVIEPIKDKQTSENQELTFYIKANDIDGDDLTLTYNIPDGASLEKVQKNTWLFYWKTDYNTVPHNGLTFIQKILSYINIDICPTLDKDFEASFEVSDGSLTDSEDINIKVIDVNRNPELEQINDVYVNEGDLVKVQAQASDEDGDALEIIYSAPLNQNGEWQTEIGDKGSYEAYVEVKDNYCGEDKEYFTIYVLGVDEHKPVLDTIGTKEVYEGDILEFTIHAIDPDNDPLTYSASNLPINAEFNSNTRTFTWQTEIGDKGSYYVNFLVSDGRYTDSEQVTIIVKEAEEKAPVIRKEHEISITSLLVEDSDVYVRVKNTGSFEESIAVRLVFPDLGIIQNKYIDLEKNQGKLVIFHVDTDKLESGDNILKIIARNDDTNDIKYWNFEVK